MRKRDIPLTYVPARNTIFLSYALAWAEVLDMRDIFIGVNAVDYSGYPDCRPEFIAAFEKLATLATKAGTEGAQFHIHAPLISMSKADIIRKARELGVDFSMTHSCYDPTPEGFACGQCDSCQLRLKGFREAGLEDPIRYAAGMNRLAGMFRLTRSEQRVVVILVLALLAVALLTRSREMPAPPVQPIAEPSTTPVPADSD